MNQTFFFRRVRLTPGETRPLQVLLNNQTLACFIPEAKTNPGIPEIASLLDLSKRRHGNPMLQNIPVLSPKKVDNGFALLGNHSSVCHPSVFFLFFMQTCKPGSVAMKRWLTREVIPNTPLFKSSLAIVTNDAELKKLIGRQKLTGQILINLKMVKAGNKKPLLNVEPADIPTEEEEPCQKN